METQFQSASRKADSATKIRALEAERNNLETEIILLKRKSRSKGVEAYTVSLENEVGTLRVEKTLLEEAGPPWRLLTTPSQTAKALHLFLRLKPTPPKQEFSNNEGIVQPISSETSSGAR